MTSQDITAKVREVIVSSDPKRHGALVGHVGPSEFPIGGPDAVGQILPDPILTTCSAHRSPHALP